MIHRNTCSGAYSYSAGTQHGDLHLAVVTTSRVACCLFHRGTCFSHTEHNKNEETELATSETEWTG